MYERMLDPGRQPSEAELAAYCGGTAALFTELNNWLSQTYGTARTVTFPYGKHYGWGVAHRKKGKLLCHVFAEDQAFTVMMRLSDAQFSSVYAQLSAGTQDCIDHKYPCGNGGWIHYRITTQEQFEDIQTLLSVKCSS